MCCDTRARAVRRIAGRWLLARYHLGDQEAQERKQMHALADALTCTHFVGRVHPE
jgi:hypothetical protein